MKNLETIDKYLVLAGFVVLILAFIVVMTVRSLFSSYFTTQQVVETDQQVQGSYLNEQNLDKAYKYYSDKKTNVLDLKI